MSVISANTLFARPCEFIMGGVALDAMPAASYPEVAFSGRSNVGKSSLVNALTGRKTLAKASNTPGRTKEINFFLLADALMLVDLPGYGYAKAPRDDVERWTRLVKSYLAGRPSLRRVCLLIDSRHGVKEVDQGIMTLLDKVAVSYQVVLTKTDKIKASELKEITEKAYATLKKHPAVHPEIIATSSESGDGIETLRAELARFTHVTRKT